MDSPTLDELVDILEATTSAHVATIEPVMNGARIRDLRQLVREVPASSDVVHRVARILMATDPRRPESSESVRTMLRFGASPRGGQAILLLAKAHALVKGRVHVSQEDVDRVTLPALRHRLVFDFEGEASDVTPDQLLSEILESV